MRRLLIIVLVALVVVPAALAWRKPTLTERARILVALPASYHEPCIRYKIRVSSADARFAAVYFSFVTTPGTTCRRFAGQVLMKRKTLTSGHWKNVAAGSFWPCKLRFPGANKQVMKDLFNGCGH